MTELIKGKPEPEALPKPVLDKNFQSNVKGLFIISDLAGAPLLKTAAEQGTSVINHLASNGNGKSRVEGNYNVVIAGAGTAGLAAAFAAQEKGLKYTLLEKGEFANTIGIFRRECVVPLLVPAGEIHGSALALVRQSQNHQQRFRAAAGHPMRHLHRLCPMQVLKFGECLQREQP